MRAKQAAFAVALVAAATLVHGGPNEELVKIEPSLSVVPANHLKFYLHFREPMERGDVFRNLRLVEIGDAGNVVSEVPEPFREVELWDETFTRMTLWFHPGRQKPGVNLNVEIGPILEVGKRYRLELSGEWMTETGRVLGNDRGFEFRAGAIDVSQPDPSDWLVEQDEEATILVKTGEPLDPASAEKRISVFDPSGDRLKDLDFFVLPDSLKIQGPGWRRGEYRMEVDPKLEDLAGNSVARPFNLDLEQQPDFEETSEPVVIRFTLP